MRRKVFSARTIISLAALATFFFFGQFEKASAQQLARNGSPEKSISPPPFFPLDEVKPGLKGVATTVFSGSEPKEFNVEILGVQTGGIGPRQDLIIGRLSGGEADRTFVFAGMSGSPVFIDGKLLGAVSYSFPFSKEPICGITPIGQMISIFEKNGTQAPKTERPRAVSYAQMAAAEWKPDFPKNIAASALTGNPGMPSLAGQMIQPIAMPLSFGGFSQATLNIFAPQLISAGLLPVSAIGGHTAISPLKKADSNTLTGGRSVSMHLTRGDYSLAASGTVTMRDGEKVYAFGHQFLGLGATDLPMSESHVVTVVPNVNNSFKLAVADDMVGAMSQDRNTGVFGTLGQNPKMIPVKLKVETSRNGIENYNYEVARDDFLTPLLMNITVFNSITATERNLGDSTISIEGKVEIAGQEAIRIERRFSSPQATQFAAGSVAVPMSLLLNSGFQNVEVKGIELSVKSLDGSRTALLERISLDKTEARAGETFEIQAFMRTDTGQFLARRIPMKIPLDTPPGSLLVSLGDGNSIQQVSASRQFVPKTLGDLIKNINQVKKNDRLYAQLYRVSNGAIIGSSELPNLPPSMLATLNNDRTAGGVTPTVLTVLSEQEVSPSEHVVSGQQVLVIEVVK